MAQRIVSSARAPHSIRGVRIAITTFEALFSIVLVLGVAPIPGLCLTGFAVVHADLRVFEGGCLCTLLSFIQRRDSDQGQQVGDKGSFDALVECGVAAERAGKVDFDEPRLELAIDENVETEKFEAVIAMGHIGLDRLEHKWFRRNDRFDTNILYLSPYHTIVDTLGPECIS